MMCRRLLLLLSVTAGLLALLAGCPLPLELSGSLTISVADNISAKTLLPPLSMDAHVFVITGAGPGGASFSRSTDGAEVTVQGLAFGDWTVTVEARNAADTVIGRGVETATVHTGRTTTLSVSVTPLPGNGALSLEVTWVDAQVEVPSIAASLTAADGTQTELGFRVGSGEATLDSFAASAGYYTLALQLLDYGINVMGAVEVVRIVQDQTTSGTYEFTNINPPGGTLIVNIDPALADPIPLSLDGVAPTVTRGASIAASASAGDGTTGVTYVWYLNGVSRATGAGWTFGSDLPLGWYRLDVTGFTADGTRAGSASASFQVVPIADDFETYPVGGYPAGWYNLWSGADDGTVTTDAAFSGRQSFRLTGYTGWVRADGIDLPLAGFATLTYRIAVMVPAGQATGGAVGFFQRRSPFESTDFNSVHLYPGREITANGSIGSATGIICQAGRWYDVIVEIDYAALRMNVWIDGREVVWNLPAREKSASSTFFVGTLWSSSPGTTTAYFDNVSFF